MSDKREKLSILQALTVCNLKEICEKNKLKDILAQKRNWLSLWLIIWRFL